MLREQQKIKQLEEEIALLEAENEKLKKDYYIATETEIYKTAKSYSYRDSALLYRTIPLSMITTPFYYKRELLAKKATACFMPKILKRTKSQADFALDFNPQLHFAMLCERVITSTQGIMFVLSDPYRTVQTVPIKTMTEDEAVNYVGKIVIAKLIIPDGYESKTIFELKAIKQTNYASGYHIEHEDWSILRQYLNVTGTKICMDALKEMERDFSYKYPNVNDHMQSYSTWVHENEFRISTDKRLMCFHVKNDIIWYSDELRFPDELGPFSIDRCYKTNKCFDDILGTNQSANLSLLLTGEENFEIFIDT